MIVIFILITYKLVIYYNLILHLRLLQLSRGSGLLVSWANRSLSEANCSSKSKRSRLGGCGSRRQGGKTAGWSAGMGVSNCGGMSVSGSCFTPSW